MSKCSGLVSLHLSVVDGGCERYKRLEGDRRGSRAIEGRKSGAKRDKERGREKREREREREEERIC